MAYVGLLAGNDAVQHALHEGATPDGDRQCLETFREVCAIGGLASYAQSITKRPIRVRQAAQSFGAVRSRQSDV